HGDIAQNEAAIEFHALTVGDRIVATFAGGEHRGRFHGMVNSFDRDPDIARSSPGDLLVSRIIEEKCRIGLKRFDLGIGEGRYKDTWCDRRESLFETIVPISIRGRMFALAESLRVKTKRAIKQNDWTWAMARKLRARRS
ncbi:MAG TPA: GNAT family N-acetyltransferase, partial [Beijerinckiaceae bacterium]|nr:GNAT family N-acetyltransferase [Beijerinckiaceae bacterium]